MNQRLHYRRQFLLANRPITGLSDWKCLHIDKMYLYAHPDLEVHRAEDSQKTIVLIGNIYDSVYSKKGNADIVNDIMLNALGLHGIISWVRRYAGRYILQYWDSKDFVMLPDALALKEIYYSTAHNQILCASQPNLIVKFANPKIGKTNDARLLTFYKDHLKDSKWNPDHKWIGDDTYYEGVKHLLPNHYLDINFRTARRFWPNAPIERVGLKEAVDKSCLFLQGNIKAIVHRNPVMMAVTAGTDTRTLLAASRGLEHKIYYFINNHGGVGRRHRDVSVPEHIFKSIGLHFNIHDVPQDVDDEFRRIFLSNTFFATDRLLPTIYNVYFKHHSDKVNIVGIGEIGRTRFGMATRKLNGYRIAYKMGYKDDRYAIQKCEQILAEMRQVYRTYGVNVLTGCYWEQCLGNWGSIGNSESDIAIEEVNPTNSHHLYEIFLGVDAKYTKYNNNVLFRTMIQQMWPELLQWPINPPHTIRGRVLRFLKHLGMYGPLKELKYQLYYLRYLSASRL